MRKFMQTIAVIMALFPFAVLAQISAGIVMQKAEQGIASAQYNLGLMYFFGKGVPQDHAEAIKWYKRAAEQGEAGAQLSLGVMYDNSESIPRDYAEAVKWYKRAAEQGDAIAQLNLGLMYRNGKGVPQDDLLAHMWVNISSANGLDLAKEGRVLLAKRMTPLNIYRAQEMARACVKNKYKSCGR